MFSDIRMSKLNGAELEYLDYNFLPLEIWTYVLLGFTARFFSPSMNLIHITLFLVSMFHSSVFQTDIRSHAASKTELIHPAGTGMFCSQIHVSSSHGLMHQFPSSV